MSALVIGCLLLVASGGRAEDELAPEPTPQPAPAVQRANVLVLSLETAHVDPQTMTLINDLVGSAVGRYSEIQVTTAADIRRVMELESGKQLVGCSDESCLADLAGALGARYVVVGTVGHLGDVVVIQLNLFDSEQVATLSRAKASVEKIERLPEIIDIAVADVLAPIVTERLAPMELAPEAKEPSAESWDPVPLALFATGGGLGLVSIGMFVGGAIPVVQFYSVQAALFDAEGRYQMGDDAALGEAKGLQQDASAANAAWNGWGAPLLLAGGAVFATSVVVGASAVAWLLLPDFGGDE